MFNYVYLLAHVQLNKPLSRTRLRDINLTNENKNKINSFYMQIKNYPHTCLFSILFKNDYKLLA